MTLIRFVGSAAVAVLLSASVHAFRDVQPQQAAGRECNSLRVIAITLTSANLTTRNTIEDSTTLVCRDDTVAWHFINPLDVPVEIELRDFHRCRATPNEPKVSAKPMKFRGGFFDDDSDSAVAPRKSVTMIGRVKMAGAPGEGTCIKYSVRLKPRGRPAVDHDPKLQIVEPE